MSTRSLGIRSGGGVLNNSYSLWQMGRADSGRFATMVPHQCAGDEGAALGPLSIGLQALSTVAQFGMWYEMHQSRKLAEAQFEERRTQWMNEIVDQWIEEHRDHPGIVLDSTGALVGEANKLLDKLVEHESMDVPQVLLLKLSRLSDYFDSMTHLWAEVVYQSVASSGSAEEWLVEAADTHTLALDYVGHAKQQLEENSGWGFWKAAMGLAAFAVPVVGPALGGGILGGMAGDAYDRRTQRARLERLASFPELLRLEMAADQMVNAYCRADEFMTRQQLPQQSMLIAIANGESTELRLTAGSSKTWFKRMFSADEQLALRALPPPERPSLAA